MLNKPDLWDIRFAVHARYSFSMIPRGESAEFATIVQLLRIGPNQPEVEKVGQNEYEFHHGTYSIGFELIVDSPRTLRILDFDKVE